MPVRRSTPVNVEITLKPGEEWHSGELRLKAGDVVTIACVGSRRFYAGLFDRPTYFQRRKAFLGMFDFAPGSDRPQFTAKERIGSDEWYDTLSFVRVSSASIRQSLPESKSSGRLDAGDQPVHNSRRCVTADACYSVHVDTRPSSRSTIVPLGQSGLLHLDLRGMGRRECCLLHRLWTRTGW